MVLNNSEVNFLLNQVKQEFRYARSLFYYSFESANLGIEFSKPRENKKVAFRILYSLFDKIACILNQVFTLKIPTQSINFSTMWFTHQMKKKGLRNDFLNNNNLFLRGIYWLSKDLFYDGFHDSLSPDAKEISQIRNHLEHLGFFIGEHEEKFNFSYTIDSDAFDAKIMELFKLTRECIMYFYYSVHRKSLMERTTITN